MLHHIEPEASTDFATRETGSQNLSRPPQLIELMPAAVVKLIGDNHRRAPAQRMEGIQYLNFLPQTPGIMTSLWSVEHTVLPP
jgi:hypothetical protein